MPLHLALPKSVYDFIASWADQAYPHEGCGLLIGRFEKNQKSVVRFAPLSNRLLDTTTGRMSDDRFSTLPENRKGPGAGKTEFVMDPDQFNRESLKAEKEGLDVVGVVHTHPDHPPRPSQIDASQPFLAQWSNIIVAVEKGKTREMKSWFRETDDQPFSEEEIRIL
jgi:proteasome lid subunit RPN8/RPN11